MFAELYLGVYILCGPGFKISNDGHKSTGNSDSEMSHMHGSDSHLLYIYTEYNVCLLYLYLRHSAAIKK